MEMKLATANEKAVFSADYYQEYINESGLEPYMGNSKANIIRTRRELLNTAGASISTPILLKFRGKGVRGDQVLSGNEDDMGDAADQVRVTYVRNGFKTTKNQTFRTEMDLFGAARDYLKSWSAENLRDTVLQSLDAIIIPGVVDVTAQLSFDTQKFVNWAPEGGVIATEAEKNAHLVNNADRTVFLGGSGASGVMATALGTVGSSSANSGRLTAAYISAIKAKANATAQGSQVAVTPYKTDKTAGRKWYVLFVDAAGFQQLQNDADIKSANANARERGVETNPIFQGGDLIWDGVIIRQIDELANVVRKGQGSGGSDVGVAFLCGLSAVTVAWGQMPEFPTEEIDYKFRKGVAVEELRGVKKTSFAGVQFGVVTVYHTETPALL